MNKLIIAACNGESLDWTDRCKGWDIIPNYEVQPAGREAYVYLDYIVFHYPWLNGDHVFVQGNPLDHDKDFLYHLLNTDCPYFGKVHECGPTGIPDADWTPLHSWSDVLNLHKQETYKFVAGAQYRITRKQIQSRGKHFYSALFELCQVDSNKSAWVLERLWPVIWGVELP